AINLAINRCIEENILKDFLTAHRSEVVKVTQLDYTFDRQIALEREEAVREGLEQGRAQGLEQGLEQGRTQGRTQERRDAILNMITLGIPKETILKMYSEEEYQKAQEK
ncbi:MAG: hypothetical protein PUF65_00650, partial [Lachnospiraceae bacterium]|nr:hypothetical protein [Lachnospiraceae bacterium]